MSHHDAHVKAVHVFERGRVGIHVLRVALVQQLLHTITFQIGEAAVSIFIIKYRKWKARRCTSMSLSSRARSSSAWLTI
jgi:hypothetical protein